MRARACLVILLSVTACAPKQKFETLSVGRYIDTSIEDANQERSYASLYKNAVARPVSGMVRIRNPENATGSINAPIVSRFQGTLDDLIKEVARKTGYSVQADGERAGAPILISVNWDALPAIGLLQEGFSQAKGQARLTVNQATKTLTVHYIRRERSPVPHLDDTRL